MVPSSNLNLLRVLERWSDMSTKHNVLVLGGTGHYGRHIVENLLERNAAVRVLTRNTASARRQLGDLVEIIEGDVRDPDIHLKVLKRTTAIVVAVAAMTPKLARQRRQIERDAVLHLLVQAQANHVERVVYLSGYDVQKKYVDQIGIGEFANTMLDVQQALRESTLNWTVLGCAPSMQIFFKMIRGTKMIVPGGGPPALPTIAAQDVGAIAAQCVLRSDLSQRHIRLPGPEALSFAQAAQRISEVWRQNITYKAMPLFPLRTAAFLTKPFHPYLSMIYAAVKLMNSFPADIAAQVPQDHALLHELFDYAATRLEDEAKTLQLNL
jgi:uncharacterized protein YbjT (DUF2867 family)